MNVEELCKKMQEEKKADSDEYYHNYAGTPWYSVR